MAENSFLGSGLKFPLEVDCSSGRLTICSGTALVKQSVYIILMTQLGERWLSPSFGSSLMSYTFMDTSPTMLNIMKNDISRTILEQEPRVSDVTVEIESGVKDGCLIVNIQYVIASTNSLDNLVFPFYLNSDGEGENYE